MTKRILIDLKQEQEQEVVDALSQLSFSPDRQNELADISFALLNKPTDFGQVVQGPHGLPHIVLDLPIQMNFCQRLSSDEMRLCSLRRISDNHNWAQHLFGAIIRLECAPESAAYIIPPGQMWSLRQFGELALSTNHLSNQNMIKPGSSRQIFVKALGGEISISAPSDELIPPEIKGTLATYISHLGGIEVPKICIVSGFHGRESAIVYNRFEEDFADEASLQDYANLIRALHPPHYPIACLSKVLGLERYMTPLDPESGRR